MRGESTVHNAPPPRPTFAAPRRASGREQAVHEDAAKLRPATAQGWPREGHGVP